MRNLKRTISIAVVLIFMTAFIAIPASSAVTGITVNGIPVATAEALYDPENFNPDAFPSVPSGRVGSAVDIAFSVSAAFNLDPEDGTHHLRYIVDSSPSNIHDRFTSDGADAFDPVFPDGGVNTNQSVMISVWINEIPEVLDPPSPFVPAQLISAQMYMLRIGWGLINGVNIYNETLEVNYDALAANQRIWVRNYADGANVRRPAWALLNPPYDVSRRLNRNGWLEAVVGGTTPPAADIAVPSEQRWRILNRGTRPARPALGDFVDFQGDVCCCFGLWTNTELGVVLAGIGRDTMFRLAGSESWINVDTLPSAADPIIVPLFITRSELFIRTTPSVNANGEITPASPAQRLRLPAVSRPPAPRVDFNRSTIRFNTRWEYLGLDAAGTTWGWQSFPDNNPISIDSNSVEASFDNRSSGLPFFMPDNYYDGLTLTIRTAARGNRPPSAPGVMRINSPIGMEGGSLSAVSEEYETTANGRIAPLEGMMGGFEISGPHFALFPSEFYPRLENNRLSANSVMPLEHRAVSAAGVPAGNFRRGLPRIDRSGNLSVAEIRVAGNRNHRLLAGGSMFVRINEFYYELGRREGGVPEWEESGLLPAAGEYAADRSEIEMPTLPRARTTISLQSSTFRGHNLTISPSAFTSSSIPPEIVISSPTFGDDFWEIWSDIQDPQQDTLSITAGGEELRWLNFNAKHWWCAEEERWLQSIVIRVPWCTRCCSTQWLQGNIVVALTDNT